MLCIHYSLNHLTSVSNFLDQLPQLLDALQTRCRFNDIPAQADVILFVFRIHDLHFWRDGARLRRDRHAPVEHPVRRLTPFRLSRIHLVRIPLGELRHRFQFPIRWVNADLVLGCHCFRSDSGY
jgi:hypothetical protein